MSSANMQYVGSYEKVKLFFSELTIKSNQNNQPINQLINQSIKQFDNLFGY